MEQVTFESMPKVIAEIKENQERILTILSEPKQQKKDKMMTIDELREFLPEKPARQTIYGKVCSRIIPFEKHGKALYFRTSSIQLWLDNGRKMDV